MKTKTKQRNKQTKKNVIMFSIQFLSWPGVRVEIVTLYLA